MKKLLLYSIVFSFFTFLTHGQSNSSAKNTSCIHGPGYWKNHSECKGKGTKRDNTWDLIQGFDKNGNESFGEQTIFFKSNQDYCEVFDTNPGKGGKYYILAHKYITAELNILATPNTVNKDNIFGESTNFLNTYTPEQVDQNKALQKESVRLSSELASFSKRLNCDDIENPVIGTLSSPVNIDYTSMTLNWSAATDNVGVTNYRIYKDGVLEGELGNILTYNVTGLNPATTYSFFITALDAEGNESTKSNTVQGTTLSIPTGKTITMTTISQSTNWSPKSVVNSSGTLTWVATNKNIGYLIETEDDPTFDFSGNDGTPIIISLISSDGFSGLTKLDVWNDNEVGSELTVLNVDEASSLTKLNTRYNLLKELDLSQNTVLTELVVRGNQQLSSGTLDISNNLLLTFIHADATQLSSISLINNIALDNVKLYDANFPSSVLDQIVIDLDSHGLSDGNLEIRSNPGKLTNVSFDAYTSLIARGWKIDVDAPPSGAETESPVIGVLNTASDITSSTVTLNWSAATDNIGVTNYKVYANGFLNTQLRNVLTYQVTGLTANTNYSFYITALDAAGNESSASNTIQTSTIQENKGNSISLTTVSASETWSPQRVTKSGAALTWKATNGVIGSINPSSQSGSDPVFNFKANDGTPILVTATSSDGLKGLSQLDFWNDNATGSEITNLDVSNATSLSRLNTRYNSLTSIDLTQNTVLTELVVRGDQQLSSGTLDISNNPLLSFIQADATKLIYISLTNNKALNNVKLYGADFPSSVLDQIVIDLNSHGLLDGNLEIRGNQGDLTNASFDAYASLISKGWSIDVEAPVENNITLSKVDIYPNPVYSNNQVSFKSTSSGTAEVKLFGSNGQIIGTLFYGETTKEKDYVLDYDLNKLGQGLYFAVFKIGDEIIRKKILVTK